MWLLSGHNHSLVRAVYARHTNPYLGTIGNLLLQKQTLLFSALISYFLLGRRANTLKYHLTSSIV